MNLTYKLKNYFYGKNEHPYLSYEKMIYSIINNNSVILDAGCGRTAPVLTKFSGNNRKLIGVDLEEGKETGDVHYICGDICNIPIPDSSVDIAISRAVLEHVKNPESVFKELGRVLKKGGSFIFLVPNLLDYASLLSKIIPLRYHKSLVNFAEGREVNDIFPAYYKANTKKAIRKLCTNSGFEITHLEYLGQYPSYFMFNSALFLLATIYDKTVSKVHLLKPLSGWILVHVVKTEEAAETST